MYINSSLAMPTVDSWKYILVIQALEDEINSLYRKDRDCKTETSKKKFFKRKNDIIFSPCIFIWKASNIFYRGHTALPDNGQHYNFNKFPISWEWIPLKNEKLFFSVMFRLLRVFPKNKENIANNAELFITLSLTSISAC